MNYPENIDSARERALETSRQAAIESLDRDAPNIEAPGPESGQDRKIEAPGDRNPAPRPAAAENAEKPAETPAPAKPRTSEDVRRWEDEGGGVPGVPPPTTTS